MTKFGRMQKTHFEAVPLGTVAAAAQLILFLTLIWTSTASAQNAPQADYIRSSQPPLLNYQELVTLGEQETVEALLLQVCRQQGADSVDAYLSIADFRP
jgi:hypothetical protein